MMDLIGMYNQYSKDENVNLIKKALDTTTSYGAGLIPQSLEKQITSTIIRLAPELALCDLKKISGKYHEYNQLTALPASYSAMGENATTPTTQSTTTRTGVNLKIVRRKGAVTNFLNDTTGDYIDAAAYEMENHLQAHVYDLVHYLFFGNSGANVYEFDGIDKLISTNRINGSRYGTTIASLAVLDEMIDKSNRRGGGKHKRAFVMSPEMLSKVSQLLTNVRLNQQAVGSGLTQVSIDGGWRLNAYRDIPIIESSQTRPQVTMGAVGSSTATSGGTVADQAGGIFFAVSAMTLDGESLPARKSQTTSGGGTSTVTITWSQYAGAYAYKIYASTTQYAEKLCCVVPATVFDANGTISTAVTSVTFTTNPYTANPTISTTGLTLITASVTTAMANDIPLENEGGNHAPNEIIALWDLDPIQGLGKLVYTNSGGSNFDGLVTTRPLAEIDDYLQFMIKTYGALVPSWEATSVIRRDLRCA